MFISRFSRRSGKYLHIYVYMYPYTHISLVHCSDANYVLCSWGTSVREYVSEGFMVNSAKLSHPFCVLYDHQVQHPTTSFEQAWSSMCQQKLEGSMPTPDQQKKRSRLKVELEQ